MKPTIFFEIRTLRWRYCNNVFKYSNIIAIWIYYFEKEEEEEKQNYESFSIKINAGPGVNCLTFSLSLSLSLPLFRLFLFLWIAWITLPYPHSSVYRGGMPRNITTNFPFNQFLFEITTPFVQLFLKWTKTWIQLNKISCLTFHKCRQVWNVNKWIFAAFLEGFNDSTKYASHFPTALTLAT